MLAGDKAHIITVFEFPPRAFWRILVKAESLYGGSTSFFLPKALSANVLMTFPKTSKLLLILQPSLSLAPVAPVEFALSLPAKSTRFIFDNFSDFAFPTLCICLNSIVTIV